ncbi:MAG: GNAT family N-acetyltransferase [Desulfobacteraceae bacterium]|nr:GNAT family N-acetyltransferase [Desulfobacteraceae bacterium]MBU4055064.1 GNAT family N-acetyltransferase [Pseudomonadota bacterium]
MDFSIRKAKDADIKTLVDLMGLFYAEADYPLEGKWAMESFRFLLAHPSLGCVWIAQEGRIDAGYVVMTHRYGMEHGGLIAYIDDLFVKKEFRQRHAASMLLEALFKECKAMGCKSVAVEAGSGNHAALGLYDRFGLRQESATRILLQVQM